ncbi:MAG: T9SS type A sorting domain-containing protein [Sphingobacteriales bacterium]|nr:MAG: T9SS type A sorting domain-containing protein [Sphingobacteriales bacterium]
MRNLTLFLITLLTCADQAQAGRKLKVLFIGNSYTYVNNLPALVASMASSMGDTLIYDSYAIGGATFEDHLTLPGCLQKIESAAWDVIVLQEQSLTPALPTGDFFNGSYHFAGFLDTQIAFHDPCIQKMFYMTWGRKNGDPGFASFEGVPAAATYNGMDSLIRARYFAYADTSVPPTMGIPLMAGGWFAPIRVSQLSPVGAVWHYIRDHHPNIELYDADESHPSAAGSYAAAATFYAALFRQDPSLSNYNFTLNATDAAAIKQAAKLLVYDSMHHWYIGTHPKDLRSQFRWQAVGGTQAILINQSSGTVSGFQWDLGDGTTSTSGTFFHQFPSNGSYTVRLVVSEGGCSDTSYGTVVIGTAAIEDANDQPALCSIYPNPSKGSFTIIMPFREAEISVSDIFGKVVYTEKASGNMQIELAAAPGIYMVRVTTPGVAWQGKLVID